MKQRLEFEDVLGWIILVALLVVGIALGVLGTLITANTLEKNALTNDHNSDKVVDLVDVSIAIDTLNKTIEEAKLNETMKDELGSERKIADVNADGELTVADLSLAMQITETLMDHFGYYNMSEPLPYNPEK